MVTVSSQSPELTLVVRGKDRIAQDVYLFDLRAHSGDDLPAFTAGAHITVTTPSGQKRRYSLCNEPSDHRRYVIAVKQEKTGRGGSLAFTTQVNIGDSVLVEPPANEFEMAASEPKSYIFIAGGIGITPIRAMIRHLVSQDKTNFRLYYFTQAQEAMAFRSEFAGAEYSGRVLLHHSGGDLEKSFDLWPILEEHRGAHLYCCGPARLMESVRDMTGHWPDSAIHFEDFVGASGPKADDRPFTVNLAKSGVSVAVPAQVSILDALRGAGHVVPSSCESGTCGTCRTRYVAGTPDHRDLVLSEREKRTEIMICVSRAGSDELTLDI